MDIKEYYTTGLSSPFGEARPGGRTHRGQDYSHSTREGFPVPALMSGLVVGVTTPSTVHGFGYGVTIRSLISVSDGYVDFSYSHGVKASPFKHGSMVSAGDIILLEGLTGFTSGPCVHIEQRNVGGGTGKYVNPLPEIFRQIENGNIAGTVYDMLDEDDKAWLRLCVQQEIGGALAGFLPVLKDGNLSEQDKAWMRLMTRQEIGE